MPDRDADLPYRSAAERMFAERQETERRKDQQADRAILFFCMLVVCLFAAMCVVVYREIERGPYVGEVK